ncbi:MAG: hypothetical protein KUG77_16660 [Nannocystaceae bacterium]|nr:hypothetical protein [Nannocystaceae bacterium]
MRSTTPLSTTLLLAAASLVAAGCMKNSMSASAPKGGDATAGGPAAQASPPPPSPVPGMPPPPAQAQARDIEVLAEPAMAMMEDVVFAEDALAGVVANKRNVASWAHVRAFPTPDYSAAYEGPRTDFRETIFWQPSVRTGDDGKATVRFYLSDSVTSFRATAQGAAPGQVGVGDKLVASKLPMSLVARLPVEVSRGDRIDLPITLTNTTAQAIKGDLALSHGAAFSLAGGDARASRKVPAHRRRTEYISLDVIGSGDDPSAGTIDLSVSAQNIKDAMRRTVRVVPPGFPQEESVGGTLHSSESFTLDMPKAVPGSVHARLALYPSTQAQLIAGTEALLGEPGGCFEQASSTNYPNVMVLQYLRENGASAPAIEDMAQAKLDRGYKLLTGYEASDQGYEWFGANPGHETLSAYGLMQFADMATVYDSVSPKMVQRTSKWLMGRRDGKGGYKRSSQALDTFGRASANTSDAYITYALTEVGTTGLGPELERAKSLTKSTEDTYVLALATGALLNVRPDDAATVAALDRLSKLQAKDGHFDGGRETITMSGGRALTIETTAVATLAMLKADRGTHEKAIDAATQWLQTQNQGGNFGSTQSTVLALKVLAEAAGRTAELPAATITLVVNNGDEHKLTLDPSDPQTLDLSGFAADFHPGANRVVVTSSDDLGGLPYSVELSYRTRLPPSSPQTDVIITANPSRTSVTNGERVTIKTKVRNRRNKGLPMVVARVGIPGGLRYDTKQLDELVKDGRIDYYETREREVIAYFRAMKPKEQRAFDLHLLATVPGSYISPASSAYLYYTDEHRNYADGFAVEIGRSS